LVALQQLKKEYPLYTKVAAPTLAFMKRRTAALGLDTSEYMRYLIIRDQDTWALKPKKHDSDKRKEKPKPIAADISFKKVGKEWVPSL